jgi:hypothetical protein
VTLDSDTGQYKDARAIARAQTGDLVGATQDLRAFIEWAKTDDKDGQALIPKRRQWLEALTQGHNPFDAATLEALRRDALSPASPTPSRCSRS